MKGDNKMYILTDSPHEPSIHLRETFDALDNAFGTDEFSGPDAIRAICRAMSIGALEATSLLRDLEARGYIAE